MLHTWRAPSTVKTMKHSEWLEKISPDSVRGIARQVGLPPRTLATQIEKERLSPENVIAIAETYGLHPVSALVATGYLDEKWAVTISPTAAIRLVSEEELADEVLDRMKRGVTTDVLTTDINELEQRRSKNSNNGGQPVQGDSYDDGTVLEWEDDVPHAADSSVDEQEERLKRGEDPID